MNAYEAKQEARRQRLEDRAERLQQAGDARIAQAHRMAECIPFGQPILIGHHSEKSDRAFRGRIRSNFEKGFEARKQASEVAARAEAVGTGGISSDDPDAVVKLGEKLAQAEALQAKMVAGNKLVRKKDLAGLTELFGAAVAAKLLEPDCMGELGFASYRLSNNSANIKRIKGRMAQLTKLAERREAMANQAPVERVIGSGRIVENVEANRLQIFFEGKPDTAMRTKLKSAGFRWAPSEGAWQRHLSNSARWAAEYVLKT